MSRSTKAYENAVFKRVDNGFIFPAPKLWPFGRTRYLIVNELQKAEIADRMAGSGRWRLLLAFAIWLAFYVAVVAGLTSLSGHEDPTATDIAIMGVGALVSLILCLRLWGVLTLRPVISSLSESTEQITYREQRTALHKLLLTRSWLMAGAVWTAVFALNLHNFLSKAYSNGHLAFAQSDAPIRLFLAALSAFLAVRCLYLEFRSSSAPVEETPTGGSESVIDRLAERLDRVETANRQLRRALVGIIGFAGVAAIGAVVTFQFRPHSVETDQILLRNTNGQSAVILGTGKNNMPVLGFYDTDRKLRMSLGLGTDGSPSLGLYDTNNKLREFSGLGINGSPILAFYGTDASKTFMIDGEREEMVTRIMGHFRSPAPPRDAVENYLAAPGAKAWVISDSAHTRTISTGAPSIEAAKQHALEECGKRPNANDCIVVIADNTWVGPTTSTKQ
jgi:hypothetical protein